LSRATNVSSTEDDIEHFTARVAGERLDRRHQLAGLVQTVVDVEGIDFPRDRVVEPRPCEAVAQHDVTHSRLHGLDDDVAQCAVKLRLWQRHASLKESKTVAVGHHG